MSNLIVGHVTATTARVWTRGDKKKKSAQLRYRKLGAPAWKTESAALEENRGYVAVIDLASLDAGSDYELDLAFKPGGAPTVKSGGFRTAPAAPRDVSFLLASCNWTRAPLDILDPEEAWNGIESLVGSLKPDFMIHCGDQIYSDVVSRPPAQFMTLDYYRKQYQDSWKIKPTARVLASLPHYMMMDDHEIFDDYFNGKKLVDAPDTSAIKGAALAAYKEYQHSHNPQPFPLPALYYNFGYAGVQFFVMDVRTERYQKPNNQIMSGRQMRDFKDWLKANPAATKFVVTSVPFVGEKRNPDDKWNDEHNRDQRAQIIDFLAITPNVGRVVFLTGDMHCSYHATMTIQRTDGSRLVVHELMSSPINQFTSGIHAFVEEVQATTPAGTSYAVSLKESEFYGSHSNVMLVKAATNGRISWDLYRTKGVQTPPLVALASQPFQL
jgi:phosphodiesterase/alkaline phosphatase D-like protein